LIQCGTLIDGEGNLTKDKIIHVVGNKIHNIISKSEYSCARYRGSTTIDLSDCYVLPGLIDCHVHPCIQDVNTYQRQHMEPSSAYKTLRSLRNCQEILLSGWTTIRVAGDADLYYANFDVRRAIDEGLFWGPRITGAGHYITSTGGGGDINFVAADQKRCCSPDGKVVDGIEEMRKAVREEVKYGSDWIKILVTGTFLGSGDNPQNTMFSNEEIVTAVSEAKMLNVPVMCHAHGTEGIKMAIRAGARSIEHGSFLDDEAIKLMKEHGTYLVPTFSIGDWITQEENKSDAPSKYLELSKKTDPIFHENMRKAIKAGVKIVPGSDYCGWHPTSFNVRELERFVEFGMSPMEAIVSATKVASELLRWEDKIGTLSVGKLADIIAVPQNPLKNINALKEIQFVMKNGVVIKQNFSQVIVNTKASL
jgi:imidazolonepropionase-like amidohydrolase